MEKRLRNLGLLALVFVAAAIITSCSTYAYTLVTHNETTARLRAHEILGSITIEVKPDSGMYENEKGFRAILLEKARDQYGDEVDDVVNIAVSQTETTGFSAMRYLIIQADAIRYKEAM